MHMRPALFTISRGGRGRLSTMARPRGGDWLTDELADLAMAGVGVLVSLLADAEAAELDLSMKPTLPRLPESSFTGWQRPTVKSQTATQCWRLPAF